MGGIEVDGGEMADPEENLKELEKIIKEINLNLKSILPTITDPDLKKAIQKTEWLSRWKRTSLDIGPREWSPRNFEYAMARADMKAKEQGEPFVIAEKDDGATTLIVSKSRLLKETPFGLTEANIIYESDKAIAQA
jgi:hypothetical protein